MKLHIELPKPIGKCKICTINLYSPTDDVKDAIPMIIPCGIIGCPYENRESYLKHMKRWEKEHIDRMSNFNEAMT